MGGLGEKKRKKKRTCIEFCIFKNHRLPILKRDGSQGLKSRGSPGFSFFAEVQRGIGELGEECGPSSVPMVDGLVNSSIFFAPSLSLCINTQHSHNLLPKVLCYTPIFQLVLQDVLNHFMRKEGMKEGPESWAWNPEG